MALSDWVVAPRIALLLPTRERVNRCRTMIESALQTAEVPGLLDIRLYIDFSDPERDEYIKICDDFPHVYIFVGPQMSVGKCWNTLAQNYPKAEYYRMTNDDEIFHTKRWDTLLVQAYEKEFPDKIGLVFAKDGIQNGSLCAFPMISQKVYEIWGCFCPQTFEFFYHDTAISDIMKKIKRWKYCPEVYIEHRHWTLGKDPKDATTRAQREGEGLERAKRDKYVYETTNHIREEYAKRLREHLAS